MRTYNFAPLWRSSIGFDRLFDLLDATQRANEEGSPPYDIERVGETAIAYLLRWRAMLLRTSR